MIEIDAGIDAGAVQRITHVPSPTLNVWISRQLIPDVSSPGQGKVRRFSLDTVLHIAVRGALARIAYGAPFAKMAADEAAAPGAAAAPNAADPGAAIAAVAAAAARNGFDRPGAKLVIGPARKNIYGLGVTPTIDYIVAETLEELDDALDGFVDGRPEAYTIVELDRLAARVRKAFLEPDLAERARRERGVAPRRSVRRPR
jgi:hypothetical protein